MSATTIISSIAGLIGLGQDLMKKFPDYKEKVEKDFNESVKHFENYKALPREKRVSSYLFKLKMEIENHLIKSRKYIK